MTKQSLYDLRSSLESVRQNPEADRYFELFNNLIVEIGELKDYRSISLLANYLEDESEYLDLMWGIIHTIEIFDNDIYIQEILKISSSIHQKCPEWTSIIFIRIINCDRCREELIKQVEQSSNFIKESINKIIQEINQEDSSFIIKTQDIILAITIE